MGDKEVYSFLIGQFERPFLTATRVHRLIRIGIKGVRRLLLTPSQC